MNQIRKNILEHLRAELKLAVDAEEPIDAVMTKEQALARRMVQKAIEGDPRMLAQLFEMIEEIEDEPDHDSPGGSPELLAGSSPSLFSFYARHQKLIEMEIEKCREKNPRYYADRNLPPEKAPWLKWGK